MNSESDIFKRIKKDLNSSLDATKFSIDLGFADDFERNSSLDKAKLELSKSEKFIKELEI